MMNLVPGQVYQREELHQRYGGQRQGGISTPSQYPVIFLFSSPEGQKYGYEDGWTEQGLYVYTGEGQEGDMTLTRGNLAIAKHIEEGKDLHLFEQVRPGWVRYIGQMVCIGYEWAEGPDKEGRIRKIIRFYLAPIQSLDTTLLEENLELRESYNELRRMPLERLREVALQEAKEQADSREARRRMWLRSQAIRRYALQRAQGQCEACDQPAPFRTPEGEPFLEVHHIQRLSDGGPDHPERVAAICPNCHRRAHYADDAREFNEKLARKIQEKEKRLFGRRDDRRK